jgi:hypothetical protein
MLRDENRPPIGGYCASGTRSLALRSSDSSTVRVNQILEFFRQSLYRPYRTVQNASYPHSIRNLELLHFIGLLRSHLKIQILKGTYYLVFRIDQCCVIGTCSNFCLGKEKGRLCPLSKQALRVLRTTQEAAG